MTKQEKLAVINGLSEQLTAYPHFYLVDIEALNAEQTAALRRQCFEKKIKLVVVKNTDRKSTRLNSSHSVSSRMPSSA